MQYFRFGHTFGACRVSVLMAVPVEPRALHKDPQRATCDILAGKVLCMKLGPCPPKNPWASWPGPSASFPQVRFHAQTIACPGEVMPFWLAQTMPPKMWKFKRFGRGVKVPCKVGRGKGSNLEHIRPKTVARDSLVSRSLLGQAAVCSTTLSKPCVGSANNPF